ncbi:MAG TPA: hypothetical protein VEV38_03590 [Candidatus Eremiobacteraceae bacterium]|nr:hypothetical protein [Candidatus Eremiobacteraceae bacterium]
MEACATSGSPLPPIVSQQNATLTAHRFIHAPVAHPESLLNAWTTRFSPPVRSFVASPNATGQLIYGCDLVRAACFWFVKGRNKLAGMIGNLNQPEGIGVNPVNGDLYVAETGASDIKVFAPNSTTPIGDFPDPGQFPGDVAVDSAGNFYVANISTTSDGPGSVTVYDSSGKILRTLSDPSTWHGVSVSIDEHKLLSFCFLKTDQTGECDVFPGARGHGTKVASASGSIGGSSFDIAEHLVVIDDSSIQLLTFNGSTLCGTATFQGNGSPVWLALDRANHLVYTGDAINAIIEAYPFVDCVSGTLHPAMVYDDGIGESDIMSVAVTPGAKP